MLEHKPVLLNETFDGLAVKRDGIYVDCTLGRAGHSLSIVSELGEGGLLIGLDQDEKAIKAAANRLKDFRDRVKLIKSNFKYIKDILASEGILQVDGILFDLGVSSPQLDEEERGFSYRYEAPLDMRMDQENDLTAEVIVNTWTESELIRIIYQYGEEKFAKRIARKIVQHRSRNYIKTTKELAEIIKDAIPAPARRTGGHPAKRTFQAVRIAVNDELNVFEQALSDAVELLKSGGRVTVISFHSLEDRICKHTFSEFAKGCICPPDFPVCTCGNKEKLKIITKKPILPAETEVVNNPRARSAKLRIAEKI